MGCVVVGLDLMLVCGVLGFRVGFGVVNDGGDGFAGEVRWSLVGVEVAGGGCFVANGVCVGEYFCLWGRERKG